MPSDDFASMFEQASGSPGRRSAPRLEAGAQVEGTVLELSGGLVILDIGGTADATLDLGEFDDRPVRVGDRIQAIVKNPRRDGPELTLSLGKGGTSVGVESLELAREGGTPVSGTVTAAVKGGLTVDVSGIRAFCPVSQIDLGYVAEPEQFVGQTLDFAVIEVKEGGRNVVLSRRKLLETQRRDAQEQLAHTLEVGSTVAGMVKSTLRHGILVDLGGLDGFVHISELSRSRVDKAEDVVSVGEQVHAKVLSVEQGEKGLNVRLSLKALQAVDEAAAPAVDEILDGEVTRHVAGGLIVTTAKGDGFVPVRELSLPPGADVRRSYPVGEALRVVLVARDGATGKLRFSVGRVADVEERKNYRDFGGAGTPAGSLGSLGDVMRQKFGHLAPPAENQGAEGSRGGASPSAKPAAAAQPTASRPAPPAPPNASSEENDRRRDQEPTSKKEHLGVTRRRR